jgi:PEP-CTERM motif
MQAFSYSSHSHKPATVPVNSAMVVIIASTVILLTGRSAHAQIVIDQSQPVSNLFLAALNQEDLAQSFQPSFSNIVRAEVFTYPNIVGLSNITIQLYDDLPSLGGNLLGSGTATGVTEGIWATVDFGQIPVTAEATYYLVFTASNTSLGLAGNGDTYARGQAFANVGFGSYPQFDYTFRTYSNLGTIAPEPSTLLLLNIGITGFCLRRRKIAPKVTTG